MWYQPWHYVTGGSGFIGSALTDALPQRGDRVAWISRTAGPERITWADLAGRGLPDCHGVGNLAGMHILNPARRWNAAYRAEVISSHVETTRVLVAAINAAERPPVAVLPGVGAVIGTGRQMFPSVHIADMTGVLQHVLDCADTSGATTRSLPASSRTATSSSPSHTNWGAPWCGACRNC